MIQGEKLTLYTEEREAALSLIVQLTNSQKLSWLVGNFFPASLFFTDNKHSACLMQMFDAYSLLHGNMLSFSSCSTIHIPSGKGDISVTFSYAQGKKQFSSALSLDNKYEGTPTEALLDIYGTSLITLSSRAVYNSLATTYNFASTQPFKFNLTHHLPSIQKNPIVRLTKQLVAEQRYDAFQKIVLDIPYRNALLNEYV